MKKLLTLGVALLIPVMILGQSSGKISGTVTDEDGNPLTGANVIVVGTSFGAATDENGDFNILSLPPGKYSVQVDYIGYTSVTMSNVLVTAMLTSSTDFVLATSTVEGEMVEIVAQRPLIHPDKTSSINILTGNHLENMPIRTLDDVVATVPGVVIQDGELHIRGGRSNEISYYVNGASTTSAASRNNLIYVPQEALEEIQVQVGGYDATISGSNSGVVKSQLKTGTSEFHGSFGYQLDGPGVGKKSFNTNSFGHKIMLGSFSGPITKNIKFFTTFETNNEDDPYVGISKGFSFSNKVDNYGANANYIDTLDIVWPDGYTPGSENEYTNFTGTLSLDLNPIRLTLGSVYNKDTNWYGGSVLGNLRELGTSIRPQGLDTSLTIPGRRAYRESSSLLMTAELSYILSSNTILKLNAHSMGQGGETKDEWFGADWEKWQDSLHVQQHLGIPDSIWTPFKDRYSEKENYQINGFRFQVPGTRPNSYSKNSYSKMGFSGSLQTVIGNHDIAAGFDYNSHEIRTYSVSPSVMVHAADTAYGLATYGITSYGSLDAIPPWKMRVYADGFGYDLWGNEFDGDTKNYYSNVPGQTGQDTTFIDGAKKPTEMGFYIQDKMEYDDIIINAGLRVDILNPNEKTLLRPDSISIYQNSGYIKPDQWTDLGSFTEIQPRIGVSFPVTDKTVVYGYYGKFAQLVDLYATYFTAYDYRNQIARGGYFYLNPVGFGLEPVRTTQYEVGIKQLISNNAAIKLTGFYKNQKGLLMGDRISSPKGDLASAYNYIRNGDFATIKGLELTLTMRRTNRLAGDFNYTLSQAEGTGSTKTSYIAAVDRLSDRPNMINPLDYNQTHVGSINLDYRFSSNDNVAWLRDFGANMLFSFSSGHAYTFVYRPVGGQVDPYNVGIDYMLDTRSREALEPLGSSTTPWNFNVDLKMDKKFNVMGYELTAFARITNLFDRKNILNVYQATGSADDDGFIADPVYSDTFVNTYGGDKDGNGIDDYVELYTAVNIDNNESYRSVVGQRLISSPRQLFLGFSIGF